MEPGALAAIRVGSGGLIVTRPLRPQKAVEQHFSVRRSVSDRQEIGAEAAASVSAVRAKVPFLLAFLTWRAV
ncbi:MAG TPA: hypothetical protein VFY56_02070 [Propionibacteriaceae bacterium]|nr:hypothetical protein [Propionibacteriaceae bacterium]